METIIALQEQGLQGIAQFLVHENLLEKKTALEYQTCAMANKQSLLHYLVTNKLFSAQKLALMVAKNYGAPLIDLDCIDSALIPTTLISEQLIRRYHIVPLYTRGDELFFATDDPGQPYLLKEIQFHTQLHTSAVVVETDKLSRFIEKLLITNSTELANLKNSIKNLHESNATLIINEEAPAIQFVNDTLTDALKKRASDIHFEPYEHQYRIRYRQDGLLTQTIAPPINLTNQITSRIKIMANLDISERRIPQDGHFKMKLSDAQTIDCRVSTCPTIYGEKIVIRMLEQNITQLGMDVLGFNTTQKKQFLTAMAKSQGMILVTGPTGSGKTVSLYSALALLNSEEKNISTIEDPVEIKMPGINQVNINLKAGLTFATTLRAFLRQDPDIIMVGEIRDLETAEIAIKAAQTGHLVLSTLHTNSAAETLSRLINMGIPAFNVASTIHLLIAQRLVRRLCSHCKKVDNDVSANYLINIGFIEEELPTLQLYKACGCERCVNGYEGQIGLFELLPMSKTIAQLIMAGGNSLDILQQAQTDGMMTIYQSGIEKIKQGLTSLEEVLRVTSE